MITSEKFVDAQGNQFIRFKGEGFTQESPILKEVGLAIKRRGKGYMNGSLFPYKLLELTAIDKEEFPWAEFRFAPQSKHNQGDWLNRISYPARIKKGSKRVIEFETDNGMKKIHCDAVDFWPEPCDSYVKEYK